MDFRGASSSRPDYLNLLIAEAKARAPLSLTAPSGPHFMGLGLGAIGARVRLFEVGNYVISLEASLRAASPSARRFLDMKDQWQADARLQIGRPIEIFGLPGFLDGQIGYRSRGQAGDEIRADVTCGLRPFDRWLLLAQSFSAITPGAPGAAVRRLAEISTERGVQRHQEFLPAIWRDQGAGRREFAGRARLGQRGVV